MKNTLTCLLAIAPFFGFAQGVKANLYDKFLKKQRVETEALSITGLPDKTRLSLAFTAIGQTLYLNTNGAGWGTTTIDNGDDLKLLFSNDSVITLKSVSLQGFDAGMMQNTYRHQYLIDADQLDAFSKYDLVGIRKYSFSSFTDLTVPKQNAARLNKLSDLFVEELKKANILRILRQISVKDIRKHIGDSVQFCSRVYKTRYFEESADGPTLLDVQSDFSDPIVNVVILQKDRHRFNGAPEELYLNKEVCISGVVTLRNNLPYLVVQNAEQVKTRTSVDLANMDSFVGDSITTKANVFTSTSLQAESTEKEKPYPKQREAVMEKTQTTTKKKEAQVQTAAEFPGGEAALDLFIRKNMGLPEKLSTGEQKLVIISLEVDAEGSWRNLQLLTSAGRELDKELLKVLKGMPKWKPGTRKGVPVASQVSYLVRLDDTEAVSENSSAAKAPIKALNQQSADDTLANEQANPLAKEPITPPTVAGKKPKAIQKDGAMAVRSGPVAEDKQIAKTVRTNNETVIKTRDVRYKVRSKVYFHNEPDKSTRRNAFIVHWNNAILAPLDEKNGFIYIVFTNHMGQVSKGWLSKDDLIELR